MTAHRVRALLMGGQACVFYGAAEFSRDIDLAILADTANLDRLRSALELREEGAPTSAEAHWSDREVRSVPAHCATGQTASRPSQSPGVVPAAGVGSPPSSLPSNPTE